MKFIITESRIEKIAIKWLNKEYGDLIPFETDKKPNHIFFMKEGEVIFDYNKENGNVFISQDKIWSFLEDFFGMEYQQIQNITKKWVEEHYNLRVTKTGKPATPNTLGGGAL